MKKFIKNKIQYILITLCLLSVSNTTGQENQDQEGWSSVELNIKATKKISFSVSEHLRYRNDITTLKNHFTQFKVNYKIFKNFELGGGVRYITKNDDVGNIQGNKSLFRYQFDAGFAKKINKVDLSFRMRYQNKNQLGFSENEGDTPVEYTRFRMGLGFRFKPAKINVRLYGELFNEHQNPDGNSGFNRHRCTIKFNRKFKNIGTLGVFYALQDDYSENIKSRRTIVGLKYTYRINFTK